jgi:hypothetical protein
MRVGPVDLSVAAETMAARLTVQSQSPATDPGYAAAAAPAAALPAVPNGAGSEAALSGVPAEQALAVYALDKGMAAQGQVVLELMTGRAQS